MRCRSDTKLWRTVGVFYKGPGTRRPVVAIPTLPIPDKVALDTIAAIWYRYKTLIVRLTGNFSFSASFQSLGDDWELSLSGNYTVENSSGSGGSVEGDRYCYPSGGSSGVPTIDFNGQCRLENTSTGDVWGTAEDPPNKLRFLGYDNADVRLFRGDEIERISGTNEITTELAASGEIGFSVKSTTASTPSISLIAFAQRWTDNETEGRMPSGSCSLDFFNLYGSPSPIPQFNESSTETPRIVISLATDTVLLDGRASSSASLSINGGEVWPYGLDPESPKSYSTTGRLWSPTGTPVLGLKELLNAPIEAD